MSIELLKDDHIQKVHFRVKNKVSQLGQSLDRYMADEIHNVIRIAILSIGSYKVHYYNEFSQ